MRLQGQPREPRLIDWGSSAKIVIKLLLLSPKDDLATDVSLLGLTECTKLLYSPEVTPLVQQLQKQKPDLKCFAVQPFKDILQAPTAHYSYNEKMEEAMGNPIVIIHTSGSTGMSRSTLVEDYTLQIDQASRSLSS